MAKQRKNKAIKDPRGKTVSIEPGIYHAKKGHPEVTSEKVIYSIIDPDYIRQSTKSPTDNLYYSIQSTSPTLKCFVSVVGFKDDDAGFLKTAYETIDDTGSKGDTIWIRS